jgi:hypothetical protein
VRTIAYSQPASHEIDGSAETDPSDVLYQGKHVAALACSAVYPAVGVDVQARFAVFTPGRAVYERLTARSARTDQGLVQVAAVEAAFQLAQIRLLASRNPS